MMVITTVCSEYYPCDSQSEHSSNSLRNTPIHHKWLFCYISLRSTAPSSISSNSHCCHH